MKDVGETLVTTSHVLFYGDTPSSRSFFACFNQKPQFQNDRDNSLVSTQPTKAGEKSKGSLAMASWLTNSILYLPSTYAYALPAGMQMIT